MFSQVSDQSATLIPRGQYIVKVNRLEEAESQLYGTVQVKWVFNVATTDGKPVLSGSSPLELWQFTSKNLTKHPKNLTRPWLETLLGRELKDGEDGAPLAKEVIGKKAMAFIDQITNQNGVMRNKIQSMWPMGAAAPAEPAAVPADDQSAIPF